MVTRDYWYYLVWHGQTLGLDRVREACVVQPKGLARPGTTIMVRPVLILLWLSRIKVDTR